MMSHNDYIKIDLTNKHYLVGYDAMLFKSEVKFDFLTLKPLGKNQKTVITILDYTNSLKFYALAITFIGQPVEQAASLVIKPVRILEKNA